MSKNKREDNDSIKDDDELNRTRRITHFMIGLFFVIVLSASGVIFYRKGIEDLAFVFGFTAFAEVLFTAFMCWKYRDRKGVK
jgi:Domain of unknown function (DUF4181)